MRPNRLTRVEVGAIVPGGAVEGARRVSYVERGGKKLGGRSDSWRNLDSIVALPAKS